MILAWMCRLNYCFEATDNRQQQLLNDTDSMERRLTNESLVSS